MNRTKIEYCDYTWNPVTGCKHGCPYCYARRIGMRFQGHFNPTLHTSRLDQPMKCEEPSTIFVCSMADLFGEWVPKSWVDYVLDRANHCRQHAFLFLTKNPGRYNEFDFSENCWLGTTIDRSESAFNRSWTKRFGANRFLSVEPILEDVAEELCLDGVSVVIIGAQTGPSAIKPEGEWVRKIINRCRDHGVMTFLKDNLNWPKKIQELPWEVG